MNIGSVGEKSSVNRVFDWGWNNHY
ncbi:uncharacterized protein G2W53_044631 [Senna tora]|uniref:Uncharacterized protein n=1 Tax=Senna tora TaxID=362788 RepID=A0A834SHK2_9FABA|nr:uncharacterized protein G2W53_044631 [Senna tora]